MIQNNYLLLGLLLIALVIVFTMTPNAIMAQPTLEKVPSKETKKNSTEPTFTFSGKVTIPITTSEQIIIDLPISVDSNIKIVPIK
jgi:accessory gene regulator protein AgrB